MIGHIINAAMALGGADWWVIQDKVEAAGEVDPIRMVLEASWQRPEIVKINVLRDLLANFFPDTADGLPSVYDLRTLGRSSPVRSQTECSTCWAFAAMGFLESFLLPVRNQNINYLGLDTVTIKFGLSIRPGPKYWGITAMSPGENKFVFNAITNNTLTLKAITPFGSEQLGGTVWTIRVPKDAVLNSAGDPMTQDYSFSFTVTGVN